MPVVAEGQDSPPRRRSRRAPALLLGLVLVLALLVGAPLALLLSPFEGRLGPLSVATAGVTYQETPTQLGFRPLAPGVAVLVGTSDGRRFAFLWLRPRFRGFIWAPDGRGF